MKNKSKTENTEHPVLKCINDIFAVIFELIVIKTIKFIVF